PLLPPLPDCFESEAGAEGDEEDGPATDGPLVTEAIRRPLSTPVPSDTATADASIPAAPMIERTRYWMSSCENEPSKAEMSPPPSSRPVSPMTRTPGVSCPRRNAVTIAGPRSVWPPAGTRYQVVAAFAEESMSGSQGLSTTVKRPATGEETF